MSVWLDYSFARPDLVAAKAAGAVGVIRYLAPPDPGNAKILTPTERDSILAAGLDLALVYESYAARALEGRPAGAQDSLIALAGARALGYPAGACLYFAVDTDTIDLPTVADYFRAVRAELGGFYAVGVYGSYAIVTAMLEAGLADFGWQTVAWSGGLRAAQAVLYQDGSQWFAGAADVNQVTGHVGSWLQPTGDDDMFTDLDRSMLKQLYGDRPEVTGAAWLTKNSIAPAVNAIRAATQGLGSDADAIIAALKELPTDTVAAIKAAL